MRHGMSGRKLGRNKSQRKALFQSLAQSLIKHEQIKTTLPKAKDLRPIVEKLVTIGKTDSLQARRLLISRLGSQDLANKLLKEISPRFANRNGGYTRIVKAGFRYGDNAPMAVIEFLDRPEMEESTSAE